MGTDLVVSFPVPHGLGMRLMISVPMRSKICHLVVNNFLLQRVHHHGTLWRFTIETIWVSSYA